MFAYDTHISVDREDVSTIECLLSGQEKEKNIFFWSWWAPATIFWSKMA